MQDFTYIDASLVDGVKLSSGPNNLPMLEIENRFCTATISILGGQVLSYQKKDSLQPLLFCSSKAFFAEGKGIKGGAPICWPWFGDNPRWQGAHGFARSHFWDIEAIQQDDCGVTQIDMRLPTEVIQQHSQWPFQASVKTSIRLGKWLSIELVTENLGEQDMPLTQALHTYFNVSDCRNVEVSGLENSSYLDKVVDFDRLPASGDVITFNSEVDRIYDQNIGEIRIRDLGFKRTITITSEGSASAIVWNPWIEKSKQMADFGDEDYNHMICVETANAGEDGRELKPQQSHHLRVKYSISE